MDLLKELRALIAEHVRISGGKAMVAAGRKADVAEGVTVAVVGEPTPPVVAAMPGPTLALVAQGTMRTVFNGTPHEYGPGQYLVASLGLASTSQVLKAHPDEPLTIFVMDIRPQAIAALLLETNDADQPATRRGLFVRDATPLILDPVVRLLRAALSPDDLRVLGPAYQREILWRLITGDQRGLIREICLAGSSLAHVARAIGWIREHYHEPLSIARLAQLSGMSQSSFHRHFRAATSLSPVQFQKALRLQTARTLLWAGRDNVTKVAHQVGYDSTSHFHRDYRRMFGTSPGRDTP